MVSNQVTYVGMTIVHVLQCGPVKMDAHTTLVLDASFVTWPVLMMRITVLNPHMTNLNALVNQRRSKQKISGMGRKGCGRPSAASRQNILMSTSRQSHIRHLRHLSHLRRQLRRCFPDNFTYVKTRAMILAQLIDVKTAERGASLLSTLVPLATTVSTVARA